MANDVSVRQYLQGQGVNNSDIGYDQNTGNVTIKGQNFIRPSTNLAGTTYDSQQNLDSAYGNYTKSQQPQNTGMISQANSAAGVGAGSGQTGNTNAAPATTGATGTSSGTTQYTNPYTQQIADLMKHLSDSSSAQPADIYSSPQYAAAQAAQQRTSDQAIRQANEQSAGAGLGHSTIMTDRSQKIQDDSNNYLQTQLVPQIQAQLQQQKQQDLTNQENQLRDYMTLAQQADTQNNANRTYDAGRQDAATTATGNYISPENMALLQQQKANSVAYATATPAEQIKLHDANLAIAKQLGETYDSGTGTYSGGNYSIRTVAGQTADLNKTQTLAILTGKMPDGTPTSAQQQLDLTNEWKASDESGVISPYLAQLFKLPSDTPTEAAKQFALTLAVQKQQADASSLNASTSARNADITQANALGTTIDGKQTIDYQNKVQDNLYKIWNETGKAPDGIPGVDKGTPLNSASVQQKAIADAYKTWRDSGVAPDGIPGVTPGTPYYNAAATNHANFNSAEANVVSQFDTVPKSGIKAALEAHKSQITKDVGIAGYTKIYNSYIDPITGQPK